MNEPVVPAPLLLPVTAEPAPVFVKLPVVFAPLLEATTAVAFAVEAAVNTFPPAVLFVAFNAVAAAVPVNVPAVPALDAVTL